jgi:hypothetical protein
VVSRCVSAAGVRFLVILFPPRSWAFLAVGLPARQHEPDPDGVSTFRTRELRPGWVPSIPRGRRCSSGLATITSPRLPHLSGTSLDPATTIHPCEALLDEASTRVQAIHPSGLPLACGSRMERGRRAFPRASHPALTSDARRGGDRPPSTDPNNALCHRLSLQPCVFTQCVRPRVALVNAALRSHGG